MTRKKRSDHARLLDTVPQLNQWLIEIQPTWDSSVISPVHTGDYSISKSAYFYQFSDTNLLIYLKSSMQTSKYSYFEIKNLWNSDLVSCAKFSVSKITHYTVSNHFLNWLSGCCDHFIWKFVPIVNNPLAKNVSSYTSWYLLFEYLKWVTSSIGVNRKSEKLTGVQIANVM